MENGNLKTIKDIDNDQIKVSVGQRGSLIILVFIAEIPFSALFKVNF
jgi:hypothetical protein